MDETRAAMETDGADVRSQQPGYAIDADAVAAAIIDRLVAGRTLQPPPAAE